MYIFGMCMWCDMCICVVCVFVCVVYVLGGMMCVEDVIFLVFRQVSLLAQLFSLLPAITD